MKAEKWESVEAHCFCYLCSTLTTTPTTITVHSQLSLYYFLCSTAANWSRVNPNYVQVSTTTTVGMSASLTCTYYCATILWPLPSTSKLGSTKGGGLYVPVKVMPFNNNAVGLKT